MERIYLNLTVPVFINGYIKFNLEKKIAKTYYNQMKKEFFLIFVIHEDLK